MTKGKLLYEDEICKMWLADDGNYVFEEFYPTGGTRTVKGGKVVPAMRRVTWFFQEPENLILIGYRRFCQEQRLAKGNKAASLRELVRLLAEADRKTVQVADSMSRELRVAILGIASE